MGTDKASLTLGRETFTGVVAAALAEAAGRVFTVGGEAEFGGLVRVPDVEDGTADDGAQRKRSMTGLLTALRHAGTEWIIVAACDMPFVSGRLFKLLLSKISDRHGAIVPACGEGVPQPLCAVYRVSACVGEAAAAIEQDNLSLQKLLKRINALVVTFDEISALQGSEHFFMNINTPEDYAAAALVKS